MLSQSIVKRKDALPTASIQQSRHPTDDYLRITGGDALIF
jgi:hypothetical protein